MEPNLKATIHCTLDFKSILGACEHHVKGAIQCTLISRCNGDMTMWNQMSNVQSNVREPNVRCNADMAMWTPRQRQFQLNAYYNLRFRIQCSKLNLSVDIVHARLSSVRSQACTLVCLLTPSRSRRCRIACTLGRPTTSRPIRYVKPGV